MNIWVQKSYVATHDFRPGDFGANLELNGVYVDEKYWVVIGFSDPGQSSDFHDYVEQSISGISLISPFGTDSDLEIHYTYEQETSDGGTESKTWSAWSSISVPDDFLSTIPPELPIIGEHGVSTYVDGDTGQFTIGLGDLDFTVSGAEITINGVAPSDYGGLIRDALLIRIPDYVSALTGFALSTVKTFASTVSNALIFRESMKDFMEKNMALVAQATDGMSHSNDPSAAMRYSEAADKALIGSQDKLIDTLENLKPPAGSEALHQALIDGIKVSRWHDHALTTGTLQGEVKFSIEVGNLVEIEATATTSADIALVTDNNASTHLIRHGEGTVIFSGRSGNDSTGTTGGVTRFLGGDGADTLTGYGNSANDIFIGGTGSDRLDYLGNSFLPPGSTDMGDEIPVAPSVGVKIDASNGVVTAVDGSSSYGVDHFSGVEQFGGSYLADSIIGALGSEQIDAYIGSDTVSGGAGNDTIRWWGLSEPGTDNPAKFDGDSGVDLLQIDIIDAPLAVNLAAGTVRSGENDIATMLGIENFAGGSGSDSIIGNGGNNRLSGGVGGNDSINGGLGVDTLFFNLVPSDDPWGMGVSWVDANLGSGTVNIGYNDGAEGHCTAQEIENLEGTNGGDRLVGNSLNNVLNGLAGVDLLIGGSGNDTYYLDNSGDRVTEINGEGTDTVLSYLASTTLGAYVENGRIMSTGVANLTGNSTSNLLYAGRGNNILNGGSGSEADTVSYAYGVPAGTQGVKVNLATSLTQVTGGSGSDSLIRIENLIGSDNADNLTGSAGKNSLNGSKGNDTLDGGAGNDTMIGGAGNDTFYKRDTGDVLTEQAGEGTDMVYSYLSSYTLLANFEIGQVITTSAANLTGNAVNNVLYAGVGNNVLNGGSTSATDIDTVSYAYGATAGVTLSLAVTTAQVTGGSGSDTLLNIENLTGSNYNDKLTGSAGNNVLDGGSGNDTMTGGKGNDSYYVRQSGDVVTEASGAGTDIEYSYLSTNTLDANVENGRIMLTGSANLVGNALSNILYAGNGNNAINGGGGTEIDTVSYSYGATGGVTVNLAISTAQATIGSGSDTLTNIENLIGSSYADKLTGGVTNNSLNGGSGNDVLHGASGNDALIGGAGMDSLIGGLGNDTFDFNALSELGLGTTRDVISGWNAGDVIDLRTIDWNTATAGDQAFSYLGPSALTTTAGQVRYASGVLQFNTDSDTAAEYEIVITGTPPTSLAAGTSLLL